EPEDTEDINITYIKRETDKIDFDNDVREFAILAIPMKKLCKEDCKGLCPRCGADLNFEQCTCPKEEIDPRWEKLFTKKF
ncbi:MAG: YceD family protein, partial [Ignavibacterium sp.]